MSDLVLRLRGTYTIVVNDGAGPLNGSTTFVRQFEPTPIQLEAAAEIERLERRVKDFEYAVEQLNHWHDWGTMNEGMVVSAESVRRLWELLNDRS